MIGIFDSGMGGLAVAGALRAHLPETDIVYLGDTARGPFGGKSPATVSSYAAEGVAFLLEQGAAIVITACCTSSAVTSGMPEVRFDTTRFDIIEAAASKAVEVSGGLAFGVIGTPSAIATGVYERAIIQRCPEARVHVRACPLLIPLIESGWMKKPETAKIVKKYLHPLKTRQVETLIMGCSHYSLLAGVIQRKIGRRVRLVDASSALAQRVVEHLTDHAGIAARLSAGRRFRVFASDVTEQTRQTAAMVLGRRVEIEAVTL